MKLVYAFLGGALVGAGAALLYAPTTGARMRGLIRDKVTHYGHEIGEFAGKKGRHLRNVAKGYRHRLDQLMAESEPLGAEMAGAPRG